MKKEGREENRPTQPQAVTGEQVYYEKNFKQYLKKYKVFVISQHTIRMTGCRFWKVPWDL